MNPWSENRVLRKALSLYAGDRVLDRVLSKGEKALYPSAEQVELTLLFIDIGAFTETESGLSPENLGSFIGEYYELVTQTITKNGGTFDSFVGDSASGYWGGDRNDNPAGSACACAIELIHGIEALNARSQQPELPRLGLKIGIHTGEVSLGNFGSSQRQRYTVMGKAVNFASRICGLAGGEIPGAILVSGETHERLDAEIHREFFDEVNVKGYDERVSLYRVAF